MATRAFSVAAHRGGRAHAPENTLAAVTFALARGAPAVEVDLRTTRDGAVVLLHDATVDRTTDGTGAVADLDLVDVRRLDAAARFERQHPREPVPLLDELLALAGGRCELRLELKDGRAGPVSVAAVAARGLLASVVFTSFDASLLAAVARETPAPATALLAAGPEVAEAIATARAVGAREVSLRADRVTPEHVAAIRDAGLAVWAWGVRDAETLRALARRGVAGATVDDLDWVPELLVAPAD